MSEQRPLTEDELTTLNRRRLTPDEARAWAAGYADLPEVNRLQDIPSFASEEEEAEFWAGHAFGPALLGPGAPPPRRRHGGTIKNKKK